MLEYYKDKQANRHPFWKGGANTRVKEYAAAHPERRKVWEIVNNSIKKGEIKRQKCEICGNTKTVVHHDDYSKPLSVKWFCYKCHTNYHRNIKPWFPSSKGNKVSC